jgi:hypothetical protein
MHPRRRMTRKQMAIYLREQGIPIGDSTLDKLCMRPANEGPPVAAWWGRRPLYDPADALAWAEARMRPAQRRVAKEGSITQQVGGHKKRRNSDRAQHDAGTT